MAGINKEIKDLIVATTTLIVKLDAVIERLAKIEAIQSIIIIMVTFLAIVFGVKVFSPTNFGEILKAVSK